MFAPLLLMLDLSGKRRSDRLAVDLAELASQMSFARAGQTGDYSLWEITGGLSRGSFVKRGGPAPSKIMPTNGSRSTDSSSQ